MKDEKSCALNAWKSRRRTRTRSEHEQPHHHAAAYFSRFQQCICCFLRKQCICRSAGIFMIHKWIHLYITQGKLEVCTP
uniref:Uncharacterized protein n=1 Tax=Setaria italica TaxID=4555 RepID=K3YKK5_SETIT